MFQFTLAVIQEGRRDSYCWCKVFFFVPPKKTWGRMWVSFLATLWPRLPHWLTDAVLFLCVLSVWQSCINSVHLICYSSNKHLLPMPCIFSYKIVLGHSYIGDIAGFVYVYSPILKCNFNIAADIFYHQWQFKKSSAHWYLNLAVKDQFLSLQVIFKRKKMPFWG